MSERRGAAVTWTAAEADEGVGSEMKEHGGAVAGAEERGGAVAGADNDIAAGAKGAGAEAGV